MLRSVAVVVAVAVVAASCSSPSERNATPDTTIPAITEATTTTADRTIPAADRISVSQDFGVSLDGVHYRGGLNIVNSSGSVIAASFLMVEFLQNGTVTDGMFLVENGEPLLFLTPGSNWFAFSASGQAPAEALRLRPPEAAYAELPGTFDTTIEIERGLVGTLVSGTVTSAWQSNLGHVVVNVVWFDSSGEPTLGLRQIAPIVVVGAAGAFEIETSAPIDGSWTYVVNTFEVVVGQLDEL